MADSVGTKPRVKRNGEVWFAEKLVGHVRKMTFMGGFRAYDLSGALIGHSRTQRKAVDALCVRSEVQGG